MSHYLTKSGSFRDIYDGFAWQLPRDYNLAHDVCDRHAGDPDRLALVHQTGSEIHRYSFRDIQRRANQFANMAGAFGLRRGDRVMIYLPQDPAVGITHCSPSAPMAQI